MERKKTKTTIRIKPKDELFIFRSMAIRRLKNLAEKNIKIKKTSTEELVRQHLASFGYKMPDRASEAVSYVANLFWQGKIGETFLDVPIKAFKEQLDELKSEIYAIFERQCMCCGAIPPETIDVDHIKPKSKYPELLLDWDNLQLLCNYCNSKKGNRNEIDYRTEEQKERVREHFKNKKAYVM